MICGLIFLCLVACVRSCVLPRGGIQLGGAETYKILSQNGCTTLDGVDDVKQFQEVQKAFDTIGMAKDVQMQVRTGESYRTLCRRGSSRAEVLKIGGGCLGDRRARPQGLVLLLAGEACESCSSAEV